MDVEEPQKRTECWWCREKTSFPEHQIRLDSLSLQALTKHVGKSLQDIGKNTRKKKAFREYLSYSLPVALQARFLEQAANSEDADTLLNMYSLFLPFQKLPVQNVDLCGNHRFCFINLEVKYLCTCPRCLMNFDQWYPHYHFDQLGADQLTKLYNYLLRSKSIRQLEGIAFAARMTALKKTNLPNILARARSLTKVVILEGADNHILRILGTNCPSLKHLDVSHSWSVNDAGLKNLLLKRPPRISISVDPVHIMGTLFFYWLRFQDISVRENFPNIPRLEKNACAATLDVLILTGTQVSFQGCDFACECMPKSYLHAMRPIIKVARMKMKQCAWVNIDLRWQTENAIQAMNLPRFQNADVLVVQYKPQPRSIGSTTRPASEENRTSVMLVHYHQSFCDSFICVALKMDGTRVTSLVLPFYSLEWKFRDRHNRLHLRTLADTFPNLVSFWGCLRGVWNEDPLINRRMIHLKKVNAWAVYSTSVVSILRHCSSLKMVEHNQLNFREQPVNGDHDLVNGEPAPRLTHAALEHCFQENPSLKANLEELTLQPANLGPQALTFLAENCRNIRKIGDLATWNITKADIARISGELVENGRKLPAFSLFNTPPSDSAAKEWDSWMPFE